MRGEGERERERERKREREARQHNPACLICKSNKPRFRLMRFTLGPSRTWFPSHFSDCCSMKSATPMISACLLPAAWRLPRRCCDLVFITRLIRPPLPALRWRGVSASWLKLSMAAAVKQLEKGNRQYSVAQRESLLPPSRQMLSYC